MERKEIISKKEHAMAIVLAKKYPMTSKTSSLIRAYQP